MQMTTQATTDKKAGLAMLALLLAIGFAQAVQVWIPDSVPGASGDTVAVPLLVSGYQGMNVISADITVLFGDNVLTATGSYRLGNATSGWMVATNPFPCSLLVGMASADPLASGDTLIFLDFAVDAADTTTITLLRCRLNEGQVPCTTRAGRFFGYVPGVEEAHRRQVAAEFALAPNPAHGAVCLRAAQTGRIEITDAAGNLVRQFTSQPAVTWDGCDESGRPVPDGIYFCTLQSGRVSTCRKLVLAR